MINKDFGLKYLFDSIIVHVSSLLRELHASVVNYLDRQSTWSSIPSFFCLGAISFLNRQASR